MTNMSQDISELAKALSTAQAEIGNPIKDSTNPHYKSKYADLAEVLNTIRSAFPKNGLSITQHPSYVDGLVCVETFVMHSSGQWMSSTVSSPVSRNDAQGIGSAITYCRRYSLAAICGIAQEDDDGNSASEKAFSQFKKKPEPKKEDEALRNDDFDPPARPTKLEMPAECPTNLDAVFGIPDLMCDKIEVMRAFKGKLFSEMTPLQLELVSSETKKMSEMTKSETNRKWFMLIHSAVEKERGKK